MDIHVHHYLHFTPDSSGATITALLHTIKAQGESIMKTVADLTQEIEQLKTAVSGALAREDAAIAAAQAAEQKAEDAAAALQAQLDAGAIPDASVADIQSVIDGLDAVRPDPSTSTPAPTDPNAGETPVP